MGDRISFRERGEGLAQKTASTGAVSIVEPRVRFRKGWLTGGVDPADGSVECGDGTEFPMLVTADQLHEIAYRVYDAVFTSGSMTYSPPFYTTLSVQNSPGTAPIDLGPPAVWADKAEAEVLASGDVFTERGLIYGFKHNTDDLSPEKDHLMGVVYHFDTANFGANLDGFDYREYKIDRPISQWDGLPESSDLASRILVSPAYDTNTDKQFGFRQIFAAESNGNTATIYGIWATASVAYIGGGGLTSSLEVAYFGADDPYDTAASLYLQLKFQIITDIGFSTLKSGTFDTIRCNLVLQLAEGYTISCPIYGNQFESAFGTDFVCQAFRWWPYETTAGLPAYDTNTGLPENGGAGV